MPLATTDGTRKHMDVAAEDEPIGLRRRSRDVGGKGERRDGGNSLGSSRGPAQASGVNGS